MKYIPVKEGQSNAQLEMIRRADGDQQQEDQSNEHVDHSS